MEHKIGDRLRIKSNVPDRFRGQLAYILGFSGNDFQVQLTGKLINNENNIILNSNQFINLEHLNLPFNSFENSSRMTQSVCPPKQINFTFDLPIEIKDASLTFTKNGKDYNVIITRLD
jgi:hypothetical protein